MDQLKKVMAQIAKHQFWIITGLSVVLGIVGFFLTSSTLSKLYTTQASALDKLYSDINTVKGEIPKHPNDLSKAKMDGIIAEVQKDVEAAWRLQYDRQTKLLVWPEEALNNKRLVEKLKKYSPIETTLKYPEEPVNGLVKTEKEAYARYFDDQMPEIVKIIGCEWVGAVNENAAAGGMGGMGMGSGMGSMGEGGMGEGGMGAMGDSSGMGSMGDGGMGMGGPGGPGMMGGMGGMGGMNPMMRQSNDLVIWPKSSQDELISSIRLWRGSSPSIYEILYTQENMWILEGIMNIIAETNKGAKANFQTSIKEIEFIRIGKPAVGKAGMIDTPMAASAGMGMGGMGMGGMGSMGEGMDSVGGMGGMGEMGGGESMAGGDSSAMVGGEGGMGELGSGEGGAVVMGSDPASGRYVDSTYAPLSGEDLRNKMQSEEPADAYFAVAKRIPVRLRFKMDQRKVPLFLAVCGNANLMLEIRQIRLGDTVAAVVGAAGMGGMMGGMGMGGMMGGGGRGGMPMGEMGGGAGAGADGYGSGGMEGGMMGEGGGGMMGGMMGGMGSGMGMPTTKPSWEMPVEVYGVIYLYNPVSIKRLGLDKVNENTELLDKVETPAAVETAPEAAQPAAPVNPEKASDPAPAPGAPAPAAAAAQPGPADASGAQPAAK